MKGGKIFAGLIIVGLILSYVQEYAIWFIIVPLALLAIRWIADLFWWGKENDKW